MMTEIFLSKNLPTYDLIVNKEKNLIRNSTCLSPTFGIFLIYRSTSSTLFPKASACILIVALHYSVFKRCCAHFHPIILWRKASTFSTFHERVTWPSITSWVSSYFFGRSIFKRLVLCSRHCSFYTLFVSSWSCTPTTIPRLLFSDDKRWSLSRNQ